MYIHEVLKKAQESPSVIRRPDFGRAFVLVPKGSSNFLYAGAEGAVKVCIGWEPRVEDLLADDWEVTRAEGIEWPESAPTSIQRSWKRFLNPVPD